MIQSFVLATANTFSLNRGGSAAKGKSIEIGLGLRSRKTKVHLCDGKQSAMKWMRPENGKLKCRTLHCYLLWIIMTYNYRQQATWLGILLSIIFNCANVHRVEQRQHKRLIIIKSNGLAIFASTFVCAFANCIFLSHSLGEALSTAKQMDRKKKKQTQTKTIHTNSAGIFFRTWCKALERTIDRFVTHQINVILVDWLICALCERSCPNLAFIRSERSIKQRNTNHIRIVNCVRSIRCTLR